MLYSLKRHSLFFIKSLQPPPSLRSIYRSYIKLSLKVYKQCDIYIGSYLFKLLQQKRKCLEGEYQRMKQLREFIEKIEMNKVDAEKLTKRMYKKYVGQNNEETLVRLRLHHQHMQRITQQKLLDMFESLHHLSTTISLSLNPIIPLDTRHSHLSKLLHLTFNISEFFTPTLLPRRKYQSLLVLENLQEDMQFQGLKDEDKEYVKDVVVKVCGGRKGNYVKFRRVNEYLRDANAVGYEGRKEKVEVGGDKGKRKGGQNGNGQCEQKLVRSGIDEVLEKRQEEQGEDQEKQYSDQWSLLSQRDRNRAVKAILMSQSSSQQQQKSKTQTNLKLNKRLSPSTLLFQILKILNLLLSPPTTSDQLHQVCRRLFKLKSYPLQSFERALSNNNADSQILKLPLLEDVIIDHPFIDEFVNKKRIVLV